MPTTTHGLVYPNSAGNPNVWEHLQNLADSIETALDVLLRVDATVTNAFTAAAGWTVDIQSLTRVGRACYFDIRATRTGATIASLTGNLTNTVVATWNTATYPILFDAGATNNGTGVVVSGLVQNGNVYLTADAKVDDADMPLGDQIQLAGHWITTN